ncbi:MAG TPA: cytochrome P450 [Anaeromyxobacteraceae bacterium]|nr:cytochrome P450 [Anaeromyxobacteraceae bacterium]
MRPLEHVDVRATEPPARRRRGWPLLGDLAAIRRDPLAFFARVAREGDLVPLRLGRELLLLNHPDHVQRVLHDNAGNYRKSFLYRRIEPLVGKGLLTAEGADWKRKRRLAQPAFHRERLGSFVAIMAAHTGAMLERWDAAAARGAPVDVSAEMMRLTLGIVGHALFGQDLLGEADTAGRALTTALRITNDRFFSAVYLPPWVPTPTNLRFARAKRVLDALVERLVAARRGGAPREDLLGMLMAARDDESGEGLTDAELRDEVMTMVLAGHETTANALGWALHLLGGAPDVDARVHAQAAEVLGGRAAALADLPRLELVARVNQESMRLFPPAWVFGREAIEADRFGDLPVPAGQPVTICTWTLHRDPRFFGDPGRFDPDRFLPERSASRPRFAYVPFAAGPRMCIGHAFATMEMTVALAMIANRYRLEPVPGRPVEPEASVTLRPRSGIWMRLVPR